VDVRTTFLGAHAVPPEFAGRTDDYLDEVLRHAARCMPKAWWMRWMLSASALPSASAQTRRVFEAATALGLPVKLHAEQLSDSGGAQLAAEFGALSCDHLEWLSTEGAAAMASAGCVAVLLPGAFYFLRETRLPPIAAAARAQRAHGGLHRLQPRQLAVHLAAADAQHGLHAVPPDARRSAGRCDAPRRARAGPADRGTLAAGLRADFVLWDVAHPAQLSYAIGANPRLQTVFRGV
jgi:imidazolonepropionase